MKFEFIFIIIGFSKYLSFGFLDDDDMVSFYLIFSSLVVIKILLYCKM